MSKFKPGKPEQETGAIITKIQLLVLDCSKVSPVQRL
jgi:hypothetical protein